MVTAKMGEIDCIAPYSSLVCMSWRNSALIFLQTSLLLYRYFFDEDAEGGYFGNLDYF